MKQNNEQIDNNWDDVNMDEFLEGKFFEKNDDEIKVFLLKRFQEDNEEETEEIEKEIEKEDINDNIDDEASEYFIFILQTY